jgi:hypothetical protein
MGDELLAVFKVWKKNFSRKNFGCKKNFGRNKFFGPEKFFGPNKIFGPKKNFGPKKFLVRNFYPNTPYHGNTLNGHHSTSYSPLPQECIE